MKINKIKIYRNILNVFINIYNVIRYTLFDKILYVESFLRKNNVYVNYNFK